MQLNSSHHATLRITIENINNKNTTSKFEHKKERIYVNTTNGKKIKLLNISNKLNNEYSKIALVGIEPLLKLSEIDKAIDVITNIIKK